MSVQVEAAPKLSKSQKKKKAAQKKKQAKKNGKEGREQDVLRQRERMRDEGDARVLDGLNDAAMSTKEFQMLNIKGKLLAHPSNAFLDSFVSLRLSLPRELYVTRIHQAQRLSKLGLNQLNQLPLSPWGMAMSTPTFVPIKKLLSEEVGEDASIKTKKTEGEGEEASLSTETRVPRKGAYTELQCGSARIMVWYPVFALCYASGDKLSCIALRDTCSGLRQVYTLFRNDITRLEQYVFDVKSPNIVRRLDWTARRMEIPPSPPPTPPPETPPQVAESDSGGPSKDSTFIHDPFRAPIVKKLWSEYDDADSDLGSPMSLLPVTPEVPEPPGLELEGPQMPGSPARPPTILIAVPTLLQCNALVKTVLPVPRITLLVPEEYPRCQRIQSLHPMKLQASVAKPFPITANRQSRGRQESWVREDVEKNLKARLTLSGTARKKVDSTNESIIYNPPRNFYNSIQSGDPHYAGEADILGKNNGISLDDVRELVTARFKESDKARKGYSRFVLTPSLDGWICKHLDEKEI